MSEMIDIYSLVEVFLIGGFVILVLYKLLGALVNLNFKTLERKDDPFFEEAEKELIILKPMKYLGFLSILIAIILLIVDKIPI